MSWLVYSNIMKNSMKTTKILWMKAVLCTIRLKRGWLIKKGKIMTTKNKYNRLDRITNKNYRLLPQI